MKINLKKLQKLTIPYNEIYKNLPEEEKKQIKQEVQYLKVLMGLKQTREALGFTQEQLATLSQIPRATITKIENGQRNATLKTMMTLANAMGKELQISWI